MQEEKIGDKNCICFRLIHGILPKALDHKKGTPQWYIQRILA